MKGIFVKYRFFYLFITVLLCFIVAFWIKLLLIPCKIILVLASMVSLIDLTSILKIKKMLEVKREVTDVISLNDPNMVRLWVKNNASSSLQIEIHDEYPEQLQIRDFCWKANINAQNSMVFEIEILPKSRGKYQFGNVNIFVASMLGLYSRKMVFDLVQHVEVYPSLINMKKYQLNASSSHTQMFGLKKIRKIGQNYEFDQINNYVIGDDIRTINWKTTAKTQHLMVNKYEDEKSQQIYSIIDNSRIMNSSHKNLSLFDFAINATLVISNTVISKYDKAGLLTFSDKVDTFVKANSDKSQLKKLMKALYDQKERSFEANYEQLYSFILHQIKHRSLLFLYTNFDNNYSLERVIPILRLINKRHLLVVVFFQDVELEQYAMDEAKEFNEIYDKAIAEKFIYDKSALANLLKIHKIQTMLTKPEDLSINTINKYLELKSRGMI